MPDVLPSSLARETRGRVWWRGQWLVPVFCANCGAPGGGVSENAPQGFICYLCDACAEKWSPLIGTGLIPDQVHAERCRDAMNENAGRDLTATEIATALADPSHYLAKLNKERPL